MSHRWLVAAIVVAVCGCASSGTRQAPDPLQFYNADEETDDGRLSTAVGIYRRMGLIASVPPISFVASVSTFATTTPDSTFVISSIAIPNRALTFTRAGAEYTASYDVTAIVKASGVEVHRFTTHERVSVPTFKETSRTDESIIFQQVMTLPPGRYTASYTVQDGGSPRTNSEEGVIEVPRYEIGSVSHPVVVYEATLRKTRATAPEFLASPSAAKTFGVDSVSVVYVESYGGYGTRADVSKQTLFARLTTEKGQLIWADTFRLKPRETFAAGVLSIPLLRADVGILLFSVQTPQFVAQQNPQVASLPNAPARHVSMQRASAQIPLFLGLGPDLPVVSFDEMVSYLRFFTTPDRLRLLRDAPPETRGVAWAEFLKRTTSSDGRDNALQEYLERIRDANVRYRGDATEGWLSDRGSVYVGLGEPDAVYEQQAYGTYTMNPNSRSRYLIWDYHNLQARIIFVDEFGIGQWKLLQSSASLFRSLLGRVAH